MNFIDAHRHTNPADSQLRCVINGTHENDWEYVYNSAEKSKKIIPAFGLHPWFVAQASEHWLENLSAYLERIPSVIGEIGLDKARKEIDFERQRVIFEKQLTLAHARSLPVSIHCVQAWGALLESLQRITPTRGFLLHAYSGSAEMLEQFNKLGAYYTIPPRTAPQLLPQVSRTRLLIETDSSLDSGEISIQERYQSAAKILALSIESLAQIVEENFTSLFLR